MEMNPEEALKALADFIDHIKAKGVQSFKGDVPVPGHSAPIAIELTFAREQKKPRRDIEE